MTVVQTEVSLTVLITLKTEVGKASCRYSYEDRDEKTSGDSHQKCNRGDVPKLEIRTSIVVTISETLCTGKYRFALVFFLFFFK